MPISTTYNRMKAIKYAMTYAYNPNPNYVYFKGMIAPILYPSVYELVVLKMTIILLILGGIKKIISHLFVGP